MVHILFLILHNHYLDSIEQDYQIYIYIIISVIVCAMQTSKTPFFDIFRRLVNLVSNQITKITHPRIKEDQYIHFVYDLSIYDPTFWFWNNYMRYIKKTVNKEIPVLTLWPWSLEMFLLVSFLFIDNANIILTVLLSVTWYINTTVTAEFDPPIHTHTHSSFWGIAVIYPLGLYPYPIFGSISLSWYQNMVMPLAWNRII